MPTLNVAEIYPERVADPIPPFMGVFLLVLAVAFAIRVLAG